jgi:hypothetical protein
MIAQLVVNTELSERKMQLVSPFGYWIHRWSTSLKLNTPPPVYPPSAAYHPLVRYSYPQRNLVFAYAQPEHNAIWSEWDRGARTWN